MRCPGCLPLADARNCIAAATLVSVPAPCQRCDSNPDLLLPLLLCESRHQLKREEGADGFITFRR